MNFFEPNDEMIKFIIELADKKTIIDMGCGTGHVIERIWANDYHNYIGFDPFYDHMSEKTYSYAKTGKILPWASTDGHTEKLLSKLSDKSIMLLCRPCHHHELIVGSWKLCKKLQIPLYYIGIQSNIMQDLTSEGIPYTLIKHKGSSKDNELILRLNIR